MHHRHIARRPGGCRYLDNMWSTRYLQYVNNPAIRLEALDFTWTDTYLGKGKLYIHMYLPTEYVHTYLHTYLFFATQPEQASPRFGERGGK